MLHAELKLVRCATRYDPNTLRRRCEEELDRLDPDGSLGDNTEHHERVRWLRLGHPNRHGMVPIRGLLRPDTGAKLIAALSPLAAPQPSRDAPDLRSPEQRDHDALDALAHLALGSGDLPVRHGFPGKLIITARLTDLEHRTGVATTIHGGNIPIRDLLRIGADMGVFPVVFDSDGQILHFGQEQRLGTFAQRCATWLLDGGCTFENCTIPAIWCQCAHGEDFLTSSCTSIDDLGPCAATTTASSTTNTGPWRASTTGSGSPHPNGSTPTRPPEPTNTSDHSRSDRRGCPRGRRAFAALLRGVP